jgi:formylglycine-generating enzyme required for sulfatase activity
MTEREIFLTVLDLPDPTSRAQYLDAACEGDPARRARIESLLLSHAAAGSFLDNPAVNPSEPDLTATQEFGSAATPDNDANKADADLHFLTAPRRPDSLGRLGHYEVLEVLGRGAFGIVFRAFDEVLQRVVAVKVLAPQLGATSPSRKRFLREARSSAKVRHENVVQVYAVEEQPLPYLVMEFIPGETLQQRLNRTGPLETEEVVQFGRQIAEGLAAAHRTGLIHRDIKPGNILIEAGPHPCVKITDFGLARAADDASLTQSGMVAGTPMFMAPEQVQGETLDHRADLFSLGSVLYTMCSGRPPFRANSTAAVLKRVAEDTPRPISEIIPEAPPWLCTIIARLHAKKPEERIATAREVADLLERGLAEMQRPEIVSRLPDAPPAVAEKMAPPREIPEAAPAIRRPRFRTRRWAVAAAVLLMLVAGLGFAEATGVTNFHGSVIRLFSPEGTLVVEVDDPEVSVKIDGSDLVITGAGAKEIRLKPGSYTVEASKAGKVVSHELVTVTKNGRQVVRVSQEAPPPVPVAKQEPPPPTFKNSIGMEFVIVPKGKSWLGGGKDKLGDQEVEIPADFYLGKYEVTQEEWEKVMGENSSWFSRTGARNDAVKDISDADLKRFPVEHVSWDQCQIFVAKLNRLEKEASWVYRLPKEAEWEYACRGGPMADKLESAFDFYFAKPTNNLLPEQANFNNGLNRPSKVGSYPPNRLGLYDMHGNVSEWCEDRYDTRTPDRLVRGGSWSPNAVDCRAARRYFITPSSWYYDLGLRLARVPSIQAGK